MPRGAIDRETLVPLRERRDANETALERYDA